MGCGSSSTRKTKRDGEHWKVKFGGKVYAPGDYEICELQTWEERYFEKSEIVNVTFLYSVEHALYGKTDKGEMITIEVLDCQWAEEIFKSNPATPKAGPTVYLPGSYTVCKKSDVTATYEVTSEKMREHVEYDIVKIVEIRGKGSLTRGKLYNGGWIFLANCEQNTIGSKRKTKQIKIGAKIYSPGQYAVCKRVYVTKTREPTSEKIRDQRDNNYVKIVEVERLSEYDNLVRGKLDKGGWISLAVEARIYARSVAEQETYDVDAWEREEAVRRDKEEAKRKERKRKNNRTYGRSTNSSYEYAGSSLQAVAVSSGFSSSSSNYSSGGGCSSGGSDF